MNVTTNLAQFLSTDTQTAGTDALSVLRHSRNRMAKAWQADGTISDYDKAKYFTLKTIEVDGIGSLSALLTRLEPDPHACLIRGRYVGDELARQRDLPDPGAKPPHEGFKPGFVRRMDDYFDDQPLHTMLVEVDEFVPRTADPVLDPEGAIDEYVFTQLPECFHGVAHHWQLSNSAGHAKNAGKLKVHLWFWLATPYTSAQLKAWAEGAGVPLDTSVLQRVQPHYTSAPVFAPGIANPAPRRSGFNPGLVADEVDLVIDDAVLAAAVTFTRTVLTKPRIMADADDPAVAYLFDHGLVRKEFSDKLGVVCPNEAEHSSDSGPSEAVYYPRGVGGRNEPGFECKHAHCSHLNGTLFLQLVGLDDRADAFDVITLTPEQEAEQLFARTRNAASARLTVDYLRTLPRDLVLERWAALAADLPRDGAQEVLDEVHRLTAIGRRQLAAALGEARAEKAKARRASAVRQAANGRRVIPWRPEDKTAAAREVDAEIVKHAAPGAYVTFSGLPSRVVIKRLPFTHAVDADDADPPAIPTIEPLDDVAMLEMVEKVAVFSETHNESGPAAIGVPAGVIDILLKQKNGHAPHVAGLVTHPIVLPSGEIVSQNGMHEASGLFLSGATVSGVRAYDHTEARIRLKALRDQYLEGFEFESELHADVALAGLFTGVQRKVFDAAPGLAVVAACQASGKTTKLRRLHLTLTGRDMPVSSFPEGDEAEVQKRLLSMLLRSPAMVVFDNITDGSTFRSAAIAAAMTGPVLVQRVLGLSRDADALTNVLFALTGNNVALGPDEVTRWLVCRLAPKSARPEERVFTHQDVVAHALSIRASVLRDVVGIVAGYLLSGHQIETRSRFPRWDRMVRQPLIWAGGADMAEAFKQNADEAEHLGAYEALFGELHAAFADKEFFAADVVDKVRGSDFGQSDAQKRLTAALGSLRTKDEYSAKSVGRTLRAAAGRMAPIEVDGGQRIARLDVRTVRGLATYRITVLG